MKIILQMNEMEKEDFLNGKTLSLATFFSNLSVPIKLMNMMSIGNPYVCICLRVRLFCFS